MHSRFATDRQQDQRQEHQGQRQIVKTGVKIVKIVKTNIKMLQDQNLFTRLKNQDSRRED